ncbi:hypothetical protein GCM10008903_18450 [Clostridium cadaveris]
MRIAYLFFIVTAITPDIVIKNISAITLLKKYKYPDSIPKNTIIV